MSDIIDVDVECPFCQQTHVAEIDLNDYTYQLESNDTEYECNYELDTGDTCERTVGSPDAYCWQHE